MSVIFVSYRRVDSRVYSGRLYDRLRTHFGHSRVFMDVEGGIARGDHFKERIQQAVDSAAAMVVVIGRQWLTCVDESGQRRLDNPEDWVVQEINLALRRGILVLPVLVDGAVMPSEVELPEKLRAFAARQAAEISDIRWDYDVGEIIKALEGAVASRSAPTKVSRWLPTARSAGLGILALTLTTFLAWVPFRRNDNDQLASDVATKVRDSERRVLSRFDNQQTAFEAISLLFRKSDLGQLELSLPKGLSLQDSLEKALKEAQFSVDFRTSLTAKPGLSFGGVAPETVRVREPGEYGGLHFRASISNLRVAGWYQSSRMQSLVDLSETILSVRPYSLYTTELAKIARVEYVQIQFGGRQQMFRCFGRVPGTSTFTVKLPASFDDHRGFVCGTQAQDKPDQ